MLVIRLLTSLGAHRLLLHCFHQDTGRFQVVTCSIIQQIPEVVTFSLTGSDRCVLKLRPERHRDHDL